MTPIVIGIIGILGLFALIALGRRALRLVVRLALFGLLLVLIGAGALFLWWKGVIGTTERTFDPRPSPTRRATH